MLPFTADTCARALVEAAATCDIPLDRMLRAKGGRDRRPFPIAAAAVHSVCGVVTVKKVEQTFGLSQDAIRLARRGQGDRFGAAVATVVAALNGRAPTLFERADHVAAAISQPRADPVASAKAAFASAASATARKLSRQPRAGAAGAAEAVSTQLAEHEGPAFGHATAELATETAPATSAASLPPAVEPTAAERYWSARREREAAAKPRTALKLAPLPPAKLKAPTGPIVDPEQTMREEASRRKAETWRIRDENKETDDGRLVELCLRSGGFPRVERVEGLGAIWVGPDNRPWACLEGRAA